jgi:hypothetical protein
MSRRTRMLVFIGAGAALLVVLALLGLYLALHHEPTFYRQALETDPAVLEKGSDRMLQDIAAIQNAAHRSGRWRITVTAEELNGWLAVDMMKNHPTLLPDSMHDPRVAIRTNEVIVGCRYDLAGVTSVFSLTLQPGMPEPNVVALRIVRARAGAIPMPLKGVLDGITSAVSGLRKGIHLEWRQSGNDPVAMLSPEDDADADYVVRIESLDVVEDEIRIVGVTERKKR